MTSLSNQDPEISLVIQNETERQRRTINLIASENYVSSAVLEVQGSVLTNKYAEGYPGRRYYGGCEFIDIAERVSIDRAKKVFKAEHANIQPHSGTQANMAAYFATVNPGDTILAMALDHGGHLTHGSSMNFSSKLYDFVPYGVERELEIIDYNEVERIANKHNPKLIVAGASAYTRVIDFRRFRQIADSVEAILMVDMAHISGLVATGEHPSPIPHAHIVTSTTHKTLRGPRGGMILSTSSLSSMVDSAVFPNTQGGPLEHMIAAKAVSLGEAMTSEFFDYQKSIKANARTLAKELQAGGLRLVSGGTDNHMVLVDLTPSGITGRQAEEALGRVNIVVNRNGIPFDPLPPRTASGIRLGTPAITSRGLGQRETATIGQLIIRTLSNLGNAAVETKVKDEVKALTASHPVPGIDV